MTEREHEIADLSKELLGRIVQGAVTNGAPVERNSARRWP